MPQGPQSAGRGLVFIAVAKLWFMVGGAALAFALPRMFPKAVSAERYGEYGVVLACISVLNNVIVTGTIQGVSRLSARGPSWIEGTKRVALAMNAIVVGAIAIAFFLAAPLIAAFEKNPGIEPALRLATGVTFFYGLYPVFVGAANGALEFHKQAGLDMTFTTLRALLVLAAAAAFSTVLAAVGGFVAAAAAIVLVAAVVVGWRPVEDRPSAREWFAFAAPNAGYLLVLNLMMFVDLWLVERYVALAAEAAGSAAAAATATASRAIGAYNGALQIARLPFQATVAVTMVVFPLVSQATHAGDAERTREYIRKAVRLSLLVVVTAAVGAAARPDSILSFVFPKNAAGVNDFLAGAAALAPLMFAYVAYTLLSITGTILNGAGATSASLSIGIATLALDVIANRIAIAWALDHGKHPLQAAAVATAIAMGSGLVASLVALQQRFGASLPIASAARVAVAAAISILVGRALPLPGRAGLASCVVAALAYLALLVATREIGVAELRGLVRRQR
jgi:O-antigen/teichoic acid export membrane protein